MTDSKCPVTHLTMGNGAPVADNQNSLTAGPRGPLLSQDLWLNEKLGDFVREVIPERRMHAKGSGAFGTFTVTHDITKYTRAKIFSEVGKNRNVRPLHRRCGRARRCRCRTRHPRLCIEVLYGRRQLGYGR